MKHNDLPQRWKNKIEDYLQTKGLSYKEFSASEFSTNLNLRITFADGSNAFFKYAFFWTDEELKEVAVFTEHCGFYLFYLPETLLETIDREGNIIKTEDYRTE